MSPAPIPLPPAARALIVALARHAAAMDHERDTGQNTDRKPQEAKAA
jgi:hypothetical protein